jgi:hypothetical protein
MVTGMVECLLDLDHWRKKKAQPIKLRRKTPQNGGGARMLLHGS